MAAPLKPRHRHSLGLPHKQLNRLRAACTCTGNLWRTITTEDPDEAVQSSDPFPSIIHPAGGDRNAGLLFSERPRNPIYSHEQRKCHAVVE